MEGRKEKKEIFHLAVNICCHTAFLLCTLNTRFNLDLDLISLIVRVSYLFLISFLI